MGANNLLAAAGLTVSMLASASPAWAADPQSVPAGDLPLKDFARKAEFLSSRISPTGDYLAVAMPIEQQTMLGIIDLRSRKVAGHLRFAEGEHVAGFWWAGPQRVVASIATSAGPLDQPRLTGELFAINADGSGRKYLFGFRGRDQSSRVSQEVASEYASAYMIDPLVREPDWVLVAIVPWHGLSRVKDVGEPLVERINVHTGERQRVAIVPGVYPLDVAADASGQPRFAYSSDGEDMRHLYVRVESRWKEVAYPMGRLRDVALHGVTADGTRAFLTTYDESGRTCLREYRFDAGALVDRSCQDVGSIGAPVFSFDDNALIALVQEAGKPEMRFLDEAHPDARLLKVLRKTFGDQRVSITSHTLDGTRLVAAVDSGSNPGDFYLVDRKTLKAEYLLSRRSWIDPRAMAPVAAISYKTRDGATIHGYLTARDGAQARKAPLVLMPHGGPHGVRDFWSWDPRAQALASRGYAVLQVNYRGSGGYGYAHESIGYRRWGTLMQDDLTDAVRWAIAQGIADPARVCIMGGSYGGYAALMSVTREPDLYRCAIGFAGVYDLVSQSEDSDTAESSLGRKYLARVLGDTATMREQSPVTHIDRLRVPVLIAHGTEDKRVPFSQAKLLRKALDKRNKPYEWLPYDDEEHGFWIDANHEDYLRKVLAFLDKHIGVAATPPPGAQTQ